jgi:hypothetical protein
MERKMKSELTLPEKKKTSKVKVGFLGQKE